MEKILMPGLEIKITVGHNRKLKQHKKIIAFTMTTTQKCAFTQGKTT